MLHMQKGEKERGRGRKKSCQSDKVSVPRLLAGVRERLEVRKNMSIASTLFFPLQTGTKQHI